MRIPLKNLACIAAIVLAILLIPLVMTIHDGAVEGQGWNWTPGDFIAMGTLLFITGLAIDMAIRKIRTPARRAVTVAAIIAALLIVWVELATDGVSRALGFIFS